MIIDCPCLLKIRSFWHLSAAFISKKMLGQGSISAYFLSNLEYFTICILLFSFKAECVFSIKNALVFISCSYLIACKQGIPSLFSDCCTMKKNIWVWGVAHCHSCNHGNLLHRPLINQVEIKNQSYCKCLINKMLLTKHGNISSCEWKMIM